ncbi:spermidine sinapoyl-coa acyltransferase [Nicotiana attenuata]|uniref:Spermidine sinapoyl-coa acyltransferase n=2 Tax=Nicotiana attenuata TaxID=49451 RepID=A0A1J6IDV6_NICAT|nr:spermidine sinapoyl-coa acyltransferase [Nicotiana attenuata]
MDVNIKETTIILPSTTPFTNDHVLSLSHLDTDINLHITFRYLRVYVNDPEDQARAQTDPFQVVTSSLSAALVHYYHYTGSLVRSDTDNRLELHCHAGSGVPVTRATVDCPLSEINYLDDPEEKFVEKLVPDPREEDSLTRPFILQVTRFKCGGWVLGAAIHHSLCDGLGATLFFNAMAELARGASRLKFEPVWNRSSLLGPREPPRVEFPFHEFLNLDKNSLPYMESDKPAVRECFKVKDEWLDRLKVFLHEQSGSNYTTFEALGAFIWRARVKAAKISGEETVKFAYATNIRRITKPQLPPGYWGNGCVPMYVQLLAKDLLDQPLYKTADSIKNSKYNTSDEYVRSFIDFQELHYHEGITAGNSVSGFTDWRHLGHATVDFGWGGPVIVFPLSRHLVGSIEPCFFLPYSSASEGKKDGFKVLVYLQQEAMVDFKEEMKKLEHGLS